MESGNKGRLLLPVLVSAFVLLAVLANARNADATGLSRRTISGMVKDALGRGLAGTSVRLTSTNGRIVARTHTDQRGNFSFRNVPRGIYAVIAEKRGFEPATLIVDAQSSNPPPLSLSMASQHPLTLALVGHRAHQGRNAPSPTGSNVYRFSREEMERLPQGSNISMRQMLIQAPGVSQDTYGQGQNQIHIHGNNGGGIQYRINGIFVPEAVSSFGEFLSPRFASSVNLITGVMPAQFGYRNEGVIDIHTRQGCAEPGGGAEFYGGQRGTIQPSFEYGGCQGQFNYFLSGFYLQDDLGVQAPTPTPSPVHDRTNQGQSLGYFSYLLKPATELSLITGTSVSYFQIPPNPDAVPAFTLAGVPHYPANSVADSELEQSYFGILALHGDVGGLDYQAAYFSRYYRLNFDPDPVGDLIFNGVAARLLHSGFVNGIQSDIAYHLEDHIVRSGIYVSGETIETDDHAEAFPANPDGSQKSSVPVAIVDNHNSKALLYGIYGEDEWHPTAKLTLSYGVRWDLMDALVEQWQFSPRISVVYRLTHDTLLHAGYARYFQVPPFESVLLQTVSKFAGTTGESSITSGSQSINAEEDNYFDAGLAHAFTPGLSLSLDGFFFLAHNKLDLAQFANTYVFAPLNYQHGRSWGADLSIVRTANGLSAYFNFSYAVLQATDVSAGQFLVDDPAELNYIANHWITLDDDQMFTASAGASYRWRGFLFSIDSIWGSGYRRGFANTGTLPPILQFDAGVARQIPLPTLGEATARVVVVNLFDHPYQIRNGTGIGVFSPQWGPRRALYGGVRIPLPALSGKGA
jgi:hypothetical protein